MSYLPYPQMPAIPAPNTGWTESLGDGIVPHITVQTLWDIFYGQSLPYPYADGCIGIEAGGGMDREVRSFENSFGFFPVSAAYELDGVIVQAFLNTYRIFSEEISQVWALILSLPVPSGWDPYFPSTIGDSSGEGEGPSINPYHIGEMRHEWFTGYWRLFSHAIEPPLRRPSLPMTNLIALGLLSLLSLSKDMFPVKIRRAAFGT